METGKIIGRMAGEDATVSGINAGVKLNKATSDSTAR
jgi:hypothetical protein